MYLNKMIGVVVPAHNEEKFIGAVIDTMPAFVDKIFVVNDASTDKTAEIASARMKQDSRVILINRQVCGGVGTAIMSGHSRALKEGMDVVAVMAGDGQMDPAILDKIIGPVVEGKVDYCKGNRLSNPEDKKEMPAWRAFGNYLLTRLSHIASGYRHISDPQNGYTAISAKTLRQLDFDRMEGGFAFENNILVRLNVMGAKVVDVPHPAIYRGQQSKIRYGSFILDTSRTLLKDFLWRIWMKYIRRKAK
jgi:glycosyltransferase involved in cell wall biosynthesis